MKRGWFAHPVQSVLIAAAWLLLQQSLILAQLITAAVLALVLPRVLYGFIGRPSRPRAWGTAEALDWLSVAARDRHRDGSDHRAVRPLRR